MSLQGLFRTEKNELQLGEPFSVTLFIKNESDHDVYVLVPTGRADGLQITVNDGGNVQVKDMTAEPEPGVVAEEKLSPSETISRQFPLSDWLIVRAPGSYTVGCAIEIETREASMRSKGDDRGPTMVSIATELSFTFRPNEATANE